MTSNVSSTHYAAHCKAIMDMNNNLRALGAQGDIDLPRITVIGNQSSGKSTLVEHVCGITLPRGSGTCTRCPMEIRLSRSSARWTCRISIRQEYDANGQRLNKISEIPFGPVLTDPGDVELQLRRAQFAVLNPSETHATILEYTAEKLTGSDSEAPTFSPNIVCVELQGPELTDLSFVDLPGLIQNAHENTIKMVEELVVSQIKGSCLILVALPMTDDIENQMAMRLARQVDPQGLRTIGVLTKPDMLPPGSIESVERWLATIEGRRHALHHGYYCTRQPDELQRSKNMTHSQASDMETTFFRETSPWRNCSVTERLGIANMIPNLSRLLVHLINESIPRIRYETMDQLALCRQALSTIPKPIASTAVLMSTLINSFSNDVQTHFHGEPPSDFIVCNRKAYAGFKNAILSTAPNFVPTSTSHGAHHASVVQSLQEGQGGLANSIHVPLNLEDMRRRISETHVLVLPAKVTLEMTMKLITELQESWQDSVFKCLEQVKANMMKLFLQRIDVLFVQYEPLRVQMRALVQNLVSKHRAALAPSLDALLEAEKTPFTQHPEDLEFLTAKWLSKYKSARLFRPTPFTAETPAPPAVATSTGPQSKSRPSSFAQKSEASGTRAAGANVAASTPSNSFSGSAFGSSSPFGTPGTNSSESPVFGSGTPSIFAGFSTPKQNSPFPPTSVETTFVPRFNTSNGKAPTMEGPWTRTPPSSTGSSPPSTLDTPQLFKQNTSVFDEAIATNALAALESLGIKGMSIEDIRRLVPRDKYEMEIQLMAEVRAYFQIAYKRITEVIPSQIDLMFVKAISRDILGFLQVQFCLLTPTAQEHCARYLVEDPNVVARRDELTARQKRLLDVQAKLDDFAARRDPVASGNII